MNKEMPMPTEYEECLALVDFLKLQHLLFTHIPNETFTKSWNQKLKNKAMGVSSGVPDYIVVLPDKILFIEMKRAKKGRVSPDQEVWIKALNDAGTPARVCCGAQEAIDFIKEYL